MVVFINSLAVFFPAIPNSPWSKLFGIVIKCEIFDTTLLVPALIGDGNFLYPADKGSKITASKKKKSYLI